MVLLSSICLHLQAQEIIDQKTFDKDFKTRYDSHKFDYNGKNITSKSTLNEGDISSDYNDVVAQNHEDTYSIFSGYGYLFLIPLVFAVVYLIYILLHEGNGSWFHKNRNKSIKSHQKLNIETASSDAFEQLISRAETNTDYRLAIRYQYLQVLKALSLKNLISIEDDKTNAEYLNEIQNVNLNIQLSKILYIYDYTWYGEFEINKTQYDIAKTKFQSLLKYIG